MAKSIMLPHEIAKALEAAGVISDIDSITRIVIDIQAAQLVQVYVQRSGDERLLGIVPMLAEAVVTERPKPVRYWVLISDELASQDNFLWPACLRPVRRADSAPPQDGMQWWLFEDDESPPELDGKKVDLSFTRTRGQTEYGGPYRDDVQIDRREVLN